MDYANYKKLEFRRRVFALAATIKMFDPISNTELGYIRRKIFTWRDDIRLFSDSSKAEEIIRIKARSFAALNMTFDVFNSNSDQLLFTLQHRGLRSHLKRDYWNLLDSTGANFGAIQETSGWLAVARRWLIFIPYIGGLLEDIFAFTPQTFEFLALTEVNRLVDAGNIIHRKNPFIVKMGVDYSAAERPFEPKVYISAASLLSILDANKRS